MPLDPLPLEQLRRVSDPATLNFNTTADLKSVAEIIGQPRGTRAIEFGIDIDSPGYNIFVLGEEGTGRTTAIGRFLREKATHRSTPQDWMYVNNFVEPHKPRALNLPAGKGLGLREAMHSFIENLRRNLPQAFEQEIYLAERKTIENTYEAEREARFTTLSNKASTLNTMLLNSASGVLIVPSRQGKALSPEEFVTLPEPEQKAFAAARKEIEGDMESMSRTLRASEKAMREAQRQLDQQVAAAVVDRYLDEVKQTYKDFEETILYLDEVRQDVLDHVNDFLPREETNGGADPTPKPDFRKYTVNLVVDHSKTQGAPVVVELNPTFAKLLGRIENEARYGALLTDFTLIKTGALHAANGGYLVLQARDVFFEPFAWDALKRSLTSGYVRTEDITSRTGMATTKTLDPEPIPLNLKVVLVGSAEAYYYLLNLDDDFPTIFKVKADFASEMERTPQSEQFYALFVAARCAEEKLRPFTREAVAKVIEYGSRLVEDQQKLTVRFGEIADLLREANHWATVAAREAVSPEDVRKALDERLYRVNKVEERVRARIMENQVFIDTAGETVGQINALSVVDYGDYSFGIPSRVTVRTFVGHGGINQIDRDMAGPIHNKGLLTLISYFNATYSIKRTFSFAAQMTFEQNYSGVEGDSASCAELCAVMSSLAGLPIKQAIGVTGAVNQHGDILPIGGVNEKIEGFFAICEARGLTGEQGVIIPQTNVRDLMLPEKIVEAVREGKFKVWAVTKVEETLELLMGKKAGKRNKKGEFAEKTIHAAVEKRLRELSKGHSHRDDDDEKKKPARKRKKVAPKKKVVKKVGKKRKVKRVVKNKK